MDTTILSKDERIELRSMSRYWDEVAKREDQSPLMHERIMVGDELGNRLLWIVEAYLDEVDRLEKEKIRMGAN